jgi:AcrR family transcriptional regulator
MHEISGEITKLLAAGDPGPGRVRPSGVSLTRRAEIIAAAIRVIARQGMRACTITSLERETGFARGHFSYHFKSKDEIIALAFAAVGADWATTQISAGVGASARERLEHHVRAAVEWTLGRPEYFHCLWNFRVEMMRDPNAFLPAASIRQQMWQACADLIREAMTDGDFHPDLDPAIEARTLFGTIDGMLMYATMDTSYCPIDELADRVWDVVAARLQRR